MMNPNLQISTVNRVQIGDPIVLKPISPINKLQSNGINKIGQMNITPGQNGQFTTSRIISVSPMRK